jgi:valyl-tRNA synthetase
MPHITEELWSLLGFGKESIQFSALPEKIPLQDPNLAVKRGRVSAIYGTVQAGRNLRSEAKIPSNKKVRFVLRTDSAAIDVELPTMARLLNADEVKSDGQRKAKAGEPMAVTPLGEIFLVISSSDKAADRERLDKEIARVATELRTVEDKLKNKSFVDRAPAAVVEEHREREKRFSEQLAKLKAARDRL